MISLAPLEWEHWKIYRNWINQEEIGRLIDRYLPVSEFQHRKFYEALQHDKSKVFFSVLLKPKERFIGVCALKNIDLRNRKAEFYICLNAPRGQGFGKAATQACLDYAFKKLNLNRVYLYTPSYNKAAIQCYLSVGFVEEGKALEDVMIDGRYYDSIRMCYLRRFINSSGRSKS